MPSDTVSAATEQQFFADQGYFVFDQPVIPADIVEAARDGMTAVREGRYDTGNPPFESPWKPGDDPKKLCKIEMPQLADSAIRELVSHPALGEAAARVSGAKMVQVWWVQLLHKPPADPDATKGPSIGWHQDFQYWPEWEDGSELFTAWVAVSDVTAQAGPMKFIPRTHKHGLLGGTDFFSDELDAQEKSIQLPEGVPWEEVDAVMKPGGVSFHDRFLLHGSSANRSAAPRMSFAIHLRTENATIKPDANRVLTQYVDDHELCPVIHGSA